MKVEFISTSPIKPETYIFCNCGIGRSGITISWYQDSPSGRMRFFIDFCKYCIWEIPHCCPDGILPDIEKYIKEHRLYLLMRCGFDVWHRLKEVRN